MHSQLDRIAPGLLDKANLTFDLLLVATALSVASRLPGHGLMAACTVLLTFAAVGTWFVSIAVLRLYAPWTPRTRVDSLAMGTLAVVATTGAVAVNDLLIHRGVFSVDPVRFGLILLVVENVIRISVFTKLVARFPGQTGTVLIVGTGDLGVETATRIVRLSASKRLLGFLHFEGEPAVTPMKRLPAFGPASTLEAVLRVHAVDEVYVAGRVITQGDEMQRVVTVCEEVGVPFAVPLHSLSYSRATPFGESSTPDEYVHYSSTRSMPMQYALKRLVDIGASSLALMLLSPLFIGVAVAVKVTSRGPVLFKQRRVGLHGCRFNMFKFRSMVVNAEELQAELLVKNEQTGPVFKMRNDPRMTPIGRFIRKYSIDELPQLINILRGDMTIVGPRPAVPSEVEQYTTWQRRRLSVRPGLTCYWQVSGRNQVGFNEWMQLDLQYIDNWSLAVDVRLILRTVPVVLAGKGAS